MKKSNSFENKRKPHSKKESIKRSIIKKRILMMLLICSVCSLVFLYRIIELQFLPQGEKYRGAAKSVATYSKKVDSKRGNILDRNMNTMAESLKISSCYINAKALSEKLNDTKKDVESVKLIENISGALGIKIDEFKEIILKNSNSKDYKIKTSLNTKQIEDLRKLSTNYITLRTEYKRYYPNEKNAAYVVGHMNSNNQGVYGLEKSYNDKLNGKYGMEIYMRGLGGMELSHNGKIMSFPSSNGETVVSTIDMRIQNIVCEEGEKLFQSYKPKKLTAIVMDPNNGDILAMENFSRYDPNNPREGRTDSEREEISKLEGENLINKYYSMWRSFAINDQYEPGSVFKLITAAAAIEEGAADYNSQYNCDGFIKDIKGLVIRCYRWYEPHGKQNLVQAMNNSCNPAFVQMIRQIGKERFFNYLKGFGFGEKTGIELVGETKGIIPTSIEGLGEANFATLSYGHGIAVSPIQMITAGCAIVNGGKLLKPRIVLKTIDKHNNKVFENDVIVRRQVISKKTSDILLDLLEHGVMEGTSDGAKIEGYRIGGKSGTSIKFIGGKYRDDIAAASYFGVFPVDNPQYAVLVIADEVFSGSVGGNKVAAPMVKGIIKGIIDYKGIKKGI